MTESKNLDKGTDTNGMGVMETVWEENPELVYEAACRVLEKYKAAFMELAK